MTLVPLVPCQSGFSAVKVRTPEPDRSYPQLW